MPTSLRNAFLTPESLEGQPACKQLALPVDLLRYAYGSLAALTDEENWEKHGAIEPDVAAAYFEDWLYALVEDSCMVAPTFPRARGWRVSSQSVNNVTFTPVTWNSASVVGDALVANLDGTFTANGQHYIVVAGQARWAANGTGRRLSSLHIDGTLVARGELHLALNVDPSVPVAWQGVIQDGSILEMRVFQNSGGSLDIQGGDGNLTWLDAVVLDGAEIG